MMGSFSWCLIDTRNELILGQPFKVLIPEVYGGGAIMTHYEDYGEFFFDGKQYDLYEILAAWNGENIELDEHGLVPMNADTAKNRLIGINIGCYDEDMARLKFPLRLVSVMDDKTYEDYDGMFSISAPSQGWDGVTTFRPQLFYAEWWKQFPPINAQDGGDTT